MQFTTLTNPLDNFLQQPNIEASPAWEFIQGKAQQKPMLTLFHSRLQRNLVNAINRQTTAYEAIQELRCIVPPMSPVPDISVVKSERLSNEDGLLQGSPDWLIEIRSPDQSTLDIQHKILHCLSNDTKLAWLIDIQRKQIWVWENQELPLIYADNDILPSLGNILELTVANVMAMTQQR
ncbi:Uma2 family endonuclease [Anabaena sp. UHCC 0451]|uniref:Uma2 family endonuclease n=1 Tax=Anabaena sp. UHCC 0451 TaxID=2055235 RepID=UPI002B21DBCC|nr:Uma2 family endonuclease [Anabaena sp. UHCC 0451]MEA5575999.1 Uma2 family endonuclease [Anabaena sp. UHCC 0451]